MLRALIVGAGSRADDLMARIGAGRSFSVTAIVEPVPERRSAAAAKFGAEHTAAGLDEFFATPAGKSVDCAFVLTPPWLHQEAFSQVVRQGLPTFCEKPMDMDLRAAERMLLAGRAAGVRTMFGFNRRFTPVGRLAAALRGDEPPRFVHTSKSRPMTYSRMLAENAVHAVDLLLGLAASLPETVAAVAAFREPGIEAEAFVSASIGFVGGGGGSVQMVTDGAGSVERLELYGRDYTLVGDLPDRIRYAGPEDRLAEAARAAGVELLPQGGGQFALRGAPDVVAELEAFAALVRGEPLPPDIPGLEAAFEAQRLVARIYRAAGLPPAHWHGQWVRER